MAFEEETGRIQDIAERMIDKVGKAGIILDIDVTGLLVGLREINSLAFDINQAETEEEEAQIDRELIASQMIDAQKVLNDALGAVEMMDGYMTDIANELNIAL